MHFISCYPLSFFINVYHGSPTAIQVTETSCKSGIAGDAFKNSPNDFQENHCHRYSNRMSFSLRLNSSQFCHSMPFPSFPEPFCYYLLKSVECLFHLYTYIYIYISYISYSECPGSLIRLIRVASEDSRSFRSFCGSSGAICSARSASLGARGGAASGAGGAGPGGAGASVAGGAGGESLFGVWDANAPGNKLSTELSFMFTEFHGLFASFQTFHRGTLCRMVWS